MMFSFKLISLLTLVIAAGCAFPLCCHARELLPGLHKTTLSNGLTAIVKQSRRSHVVAVQVWIKAGGLYEADGESGISHLIEHMMFKGTERRGPGMVAGEIESVGGSINAYTSLDYTVYHCTVPAQFLDRALDVLSDAVFHSTFDAKELEREKKVVLEEIRMREDRPGTRLWRLMMETAYEKHSYRRPVIGTPETVTSFSRGDIKDYMARRYRPARITVVVVGDVNAQEALDSIKKSFGTEDSVDEDTFKQMSEPTQRLPRLKKETMAIQEGHLAVAFSGCPDFNHPDAAALDVLAALMGRGDSSRLVRSLKDRLQLVHSIDAASFTPAGPGLFQISAVLDPEKTEETLSQIFHELFHLQSEEVSREELERAKTQIETGFVFDLETMAGEARELGVFEVLAHDPTAEKIYLERIRSITPEDIKRVARRYFSTRNINVSMIMPEKKPPALQPDDLIRIAGKAKSSAAPAHTGIAQGQEEVVKETILSNGLTLLVKETSEVPTVSLRMVFPGGVRYESRQTNGIFNFLARAWTKGTASRDANELSTSIEGMGGRIWGFSGRNTFGLQGRFLSKTLEEGLALFAEILLHPTFPEEEINKLRPIILSELKRQEDNPAWVAIREFRKLLFAPHPYAMDVAGRESVIRKITSKRMLEVYNEYVVPPGAVLSIVGDVHAESIVPVLEKLLSGWRSRQRTEPLSLPAPEQLATPRIRNLRRDKQQTHIVIGFPGTTFKSRDRFALEVMNAVLAGQGGRLFRELRDRESLAYSVTSFAGLGVDHGSFAFYIACAPEKKEQAVKSLWREIKRIMEEPVSEEELTRAKNWIVGSHEISLQTNGSQAMDMALNEIYGLGFDFSSRYADMISEVNSRQIQRAARTILNTDAYVMVTVGP